MVKKITKIGLITVTYNSGQVLEKFLASVMQQSFPNFVLYVVDNASADSTRQQLAANQDSRIIQILNNENKGFATASNQGILAALANGCDAVVLINNDTVFAEDLLSQLAAACEHNDAGMVVPKMYYFDRPKVIWSAGGGFKYWRAASNYHYGMGEVDQGQYDQDQWVEFTPMCCMLIHASVFPLVGMLDEAYFVYVEDADFCYRASRLGQKIYYCHSAKLWHKVNSLTGTGSPFAVRCHTRNRVYFIRKHMGKLAGAVLALYAVYIPVRNLFIERDLSRLGLKYKAFLEGIRMPIANSKLN